MNIASYGLVNGQKRMRKRVHGVWVNGKQGKTIGWGDLADADLVRIAKTLPFGELFVVMTGAWQPLNPDTCAWLIERGTIYCVMSQDETDERLDGVRFRRIMRPTVENLLARFQRLNTTT